MVALAVVVAALGLVVDEVSTGSPTRHDPRLTVQHGDRAAERKSQTRDDPRSISRGDRAVGPYTYGVGTTVLHLTDPTRTITLPSGQVVPRPITTLVHYPTVKGSARHGQPAHADGPFPLIVFGHGFDLMPSAYSPLLRYWTSAGFVVATPVFPLENPEAPGGPNESDLPNQPQDMRFVIESLLRIDRQRHSPLGGMIDRGEVAVAGHSDGGDTALALAYDPALRDRHLQAAVILSGAEIPMLPSFRIGRGGPPLLATQGTADVINLPSATAAYFTDAPAPKFLLQLLGANHIGPYSTDRAQLAVVERVTTAFLQYYLDHDRRAMRRMSRAGNVPGVATLQTDR